MILFSFSLSPMNKKNSEAIWLSALALSVLLCAIFGTLLFYEIRQYLMGLFTKNYFTDGELYASATAKQYKLNNYPTPSAWQNLYALRDNVLNPCREAYGAPIRVNCAYRSAAVNQLVGGASSSQHLSGMAADITGGSVQKNRLIFAVLMQQAAFDQLIWEGNGAWIHVSYNPTSCRHSVLAQNTTSKGYYNISATWQSVVGV